MLHNRYSEDDDRLLVQFIATHHPQLKGRKGNALYIMLGKNEEGKWPWSSRHPWQSWRDHYVKNEHKMNKKIRHYLQQMSNEQSIPRANKVEAEEEEESTQESNSVKIISKRKEPPNTSSSPQKRQKTGGSSSTAYTLPPRVSSKQSRSADEESLPESAALLSIEGVSNPSEDSRDQAQVAEMLEHDIQQTQLIAPVHKGVAPSNQMRSCAARKTVVEPRVSASDTSFDSLFDGSFSSIAPDSQEEKPPGITVVMSKKPRRRRREVNFFESSPSSPNSPRIINDSSVDKQASGSLKKRKAPPKLREGPFLTRFTDTYTLNGINAEPIHRHPTDAWPPSRANDQTMIETRIQKGKQVKRSLQFIGTSQQLVGARSPSSQRGSLPLSASEDPLMNDSKQPSASPTISKEKAKQPGHKRSGRARRGKWKKSHDSSVDEVEDTHSITSVKLPSPRQNGATRGARSVPEETPENISWLEGGQIRQQYRNQGMDLPKELRNGQRNSVQYPDLPPSLSADFVSHNTRESPSLSFQLSSQDQSFVELLGINRTITMLSRDHGFTEAVVTRILQEAQSIQKADEILRCMKDSAEQTAARQLMHLFGDETSASGSRHPSKRSQSLQIRPVIVNHRVSDYSPPPGSRAGQFARLVGQGRKEEALEREARRASGAFSPVKHYSNKISSPVDREIKAEAIEDDVFLEHQEETFSSEEKANSDVFYDPLSQRPEVLSKVEGSLGKEKCIRWTTRFLQDIIDKHEE